MMIAYHASHQGAEWRIKIEGYDPRDLLRGRYILFRYDFDGFEQGEALCLTGDLQKPDLIELTETQCIDLVNADNRPQRFYIPEHLADKADKVVRANVDDIRAGIIIQNQNIILKNLYYKDENLLDYLRDQQ